VSGGEPERSGPKMVNNDVYIYIYKIYVSRAVSGSRKNRAQQSGVLSGRSRSGERRSQKWEVKRGAAKQPAPLQWSNRVSAEKIASYVFVLIVYSHKVHLDSTTTKESI